MSDYFLSLASCVEKHATQARHIIAELLEALAGEEMSVSTKETE